LTFTFTWTPGRAPWTRKSTRCMSSTHKGQYKHRKIRIYLHAPPVVCKVQRCRRANVTSIHPVSPLSTPLPTPSGLLQLRILGCRRASEVIFDQVFLGHLAGRLPYGTPRGHSSIQTDFFALMDVTG